MVTSADKLFRRGHDHLLGKTNIGGILPTSKWSITSFMYTFAKGEKYPSDWLTPFTSVGVGHAAGGARLSRPGGADGSADAAAGVQWSGRCPLWWPGMGPTMPACGLAGALVGVMLKADAVGGVPVPVVSPELLPLVAMDAVSLTRRARRGKVSDPAAWARCAS